MWYILLFRYVLHHRGSGVPGHHLHHRPVFVSVQVQEDQSEAEQKGDLPAQCCIKHAPLELPAAAEFILHCDQ